MVISQRFLILKGLREFWMMMHFEIFSPSLLREEIIQTYQSKIFSLNKEEPTHEAREKYDKQMEEALDAVDS